MDTHGTGQLGNTGNRQLNFLTSRHDQVAILINDDHDVGHVTMTVGHAQLMLDELLVVLLDISCSRNLQEIIAVIHQFTQGVQGLDHLGNVCDDGFLFLIIRWNLRHEVVHNRCIDAELYLLRIDEHELQFVRMFLIEQGSDDGIQSNRLTLSCSTGNKQVRDLGQIHHEHIIGNGLTQCDRQIHGSLAEPFRVENTLHGDNLWFGIRYLNTDRSLTGNRSNDTDSQG